MDQLPPAYEVIRQQGQGGMGRVWLARERASGAEVAIKVFAPPATADRALARYLFAREFWALTSFRHPRLLAARDWHEAADGTPSFVMDLIPGDDLDVLRAAGPLDEASVRTWLPDVLGALAHLHGRGWLHGDVKPENVRIGPDGRATLMDLGLVRPSGRATDAIQGSLRYLAPEIIRGAAADARSDLYALGVVIYEALAGKAPFTDAQPAALVRAHLTTPPVPLARVAPGVSPEMEAVVARLLAKEPAARPADAAAVLALLGLAADEALGPTLLGAPLIGREAAEAAIAELLEADAPAEATLVGGAGSGKTRLLGELRAGAQLDGRPTLVARGLGTDATPYEALVPWLRALAARAQGGLARWAPVLRRVLGPVPDLAAHVPALAEPPAPPLEGAAERARLHAAVAALAEALPDGAWLLDDAEELDELSAALAAHLRRATARGRRLWVETRREGAPVGRAIALPPLGAADVAALAAAVLGGPPPAGVAERLADLSGGQPGAAEALLARWARGGALRRADGRWTVAPDAAFDVPGGVAEALGADPASLPPASVALARAAAVLGTTGAVTDLLGVAGLPAEEALPALAALEAVGFLAQADGAYRLASPARAAALLVDVELAERRALNAAAARVRAEGIADPADPAAPLGDVLAVADHLLAGPAPADARPWLEAGVRRAVGIGALDRAATLAERALADAAMPAAARPALLALRALVLRVRGDVDAALEAAEEAVAGLAAAGDAGLARERIGLGILLQLKGRYDEAATALAAGVAEADARGDRAEAVRGRLFAGRVAHFAGRPAEALGWLEAATKQAREADAPAALAAALGLRGYLLATGDPAGRAEGLAALEEAIALARAIGDEVELVDALNMRGNVRLATGDLVGAAADFRAGLETAERVGLGNETPIFRLNLAAAALTRGHVTEALAEARAAVAIARDQGRGFPESYGLALEGAALAAGGAPGAGLAALDAALARAQAIRNRYVELPILAWRAETYLLLGRFADARAALGAAEALARETGNDEERPHLARVAMALAALDPTAPEGELAAAIAAGEALGDPLTAAHARRWALTAALDGGDLAAAEAHLGAALAAAQAAALDGLAVAITIEAGRLAATRGDRDGAANAYRVAESGARELGARALAIDAMAAAAAADPAAAGARASDAAAAFESMASDLDDETRAAYLAHPARTALFDAIDPGAGLPLARLRRLAELIAAVTAARGLPDVMATALAGFAELAEADRAFLLLYDGLKLTDQSFWGMDPRDTDAFSSSLAFKALWSDEPLWVEDVDADAELGTAASVQALALRSALGVPLFDGERTIGVVLADSRRVNPRFGPAERECVRALASHTAAMVAAARAEALTGTQGQDLEAVLELATALAGEPDPAAAARATAAAARRRLGADRALVLLGEDLTCQAAVGPGGRDLSPEDRRPSGTAARWAWDAGEPVHVLDAQSDEDLAAAKSVMALDLRTIAAAPIRHGDTKFGVLYADARTTAEPDAAALAAMALMADLLGACLAKAK